MECYNCHKYGHYAWECCSPTSDVEEEEKTNFIEKKEEIEGSTLLLVLKKEEQEDSSTWYLDNGASNHMYGEKKMFVMLDEYARGDILFGDSSKIQIKGKGSILICLRNGGHKLILDVYYVPKLKSNILSLGQFLEKGYKIHMKNFNLWLRD